MKRSGIILTAALVLTAAAMAQESAPKPAPEHKKLDMLVGSWVLEGDVKPSAMGPGGKAVILSEVKNLCNPPPLAAFEQSNPTPTLPATHRCSSGSSLPGKPSIPRPHGGAPRQTTVPARLHT